MSFTKDLALQKLQRYCAYQDRCHQEVRSKLLELKVFGDDLEEIIAELISDNFLNEERFARSFVRGKFKMKGWGRNKITMHLKAKKVSSYCIKKGLEEIEEADYRNKIEELLTKKFASLKEEDNFIRRNKTARFVIQRGFEPNLVWEIFKLLEEND